MKITCKNCGAAIPAQDIELDTMLAKCTHCDTVFTFKNDLQQLTYHERKQEVLLPQKFNVDKTYSELGISYSWFSPVIIFLAFFCFFWDGFLFVWYAIAFSQKEWFMALFATLHTLVGIGLTYYVIACFFNRTRIMVMFDKLIIQHGPVPLKKNHTIESKDIKQLYCKKEDTRGSRGRSSTTYEVHAELTSGEHIKLLDGLERFEEARYIEQEIEKFLKIEDVPVPGEFLS